MMKRPVTEFETRRSELISKAFISITPCRKEDAVLDLLRAIDGGKRQEITIKGKSLAELCGQFYTFGTPAGGHSITNGTVLFLIERGEGLSWKITAVGPDMIDGPLPSFYAALHTLDPDLIIYVDVKKMPVTTAMKMYPVAKEQFVPIPTDAEERVEVLA